MADRNPDRLAAKIDGDFVVFLIGARFYKPWKVWEWLPTARAMGRMLKELAANPDDRLLGIEAYAKSTACWCSTGARSSTWSATRVPRTASTCRSGWSSIARRPRASR